MKRALELDRPPDIFKCWVDATMREPKLSQSVNVGKLCAPIFNKNDCPLAPQLALEQSNFMNDVIPCVDRRIETLFLRCHY